MEWVVLVETVANMGNRGHTRWVWVWDMSEVVSRGQPGAEETSSWLDEFAVTTSTLCCLNFLSFYIPLPAFYSDHARELNAT